MKNQKGFTLYQLIFSLVMLVGVVGWTANVFKLVATPDIGTWAVVEILRVLGIFVPPLGAVMGFV